jgi:AraC-like DNA-binding protein
MVVVINPYAPHWGRPSPEGLDYWLFYPDPCWLGTLLALRDAPSAYWFDAPVINDKSLAADLSHAFEMIICSRDEMPLANAVDTLFRQYATPADVEGDALRLHAASAIGGLTAGSELNVASDAANAGLSRAYYSRRHRKQTGLSPLHYRRQARVLAAQVMIENGTALADVALQAGFSDQAHMTRQFRQILGVTPGTYRPTA